MAGHETKRHPVQDRRVQDGWVQGGPVQDGRVPWLGRGGINAPGIGDQAPATSSPLRARDLHQAALQARAGQPDPSIGTSADPSAVPPDTGAAPCPPPFALTPMQMGLLYESAASDRPWVNLEQIVVHLEAEVPSAAALHQAWAAVQSRHAMLRSAILWQGRSEPVQQIHPAAEARALIRIDEQDWQHLPAAAQRKALQAFLRQDRNRGVTLDSPVSWRVMLLRLGPSASVMIWTIHHVLVDGRSMSIVLEDLFAALAHADGAGSAAADSAPKAPGFDVFAPAVAAQGGTPETAAFFRRYLARLQEIAPLPCLPPLRQMSASPTAREADADPGAVEDLLPPGRKRVLRQQLPRRLRQALQARAAQAHDMQAADTNAHNTQVGGSLADMIHVAWGLVLARWSGQEQAVFGITRSGRHLVPDAAQMVGCLINTVPLYLQLSGERSLDELLRDLRAHMLDLRAHEHAPLAEMRRWSGLPSDGPLFDTMVMFERDSLGARMRARGPEWRQRRVALYEEGAMPVTLAIYGDDSPQLLLEHDPAHVPPQQAVQMLAQFRKLLQSLAHAPRDLPLSALEMLPTKERAQLLRWGQAPLEARRDLARDLAQAPLCLARRLTARAGQAPQAPALEMAAEVSPTDVTAPTGLSGLSHGQLQTRADHLALRLHQAGARPGDIVAICLPRSLDFVVAMLAILKLGAAFLPVDPSYPAAVKAHMLRDSGTRLGIGRSGVDGLNSGSDLAAPVDPVVPTNRKTSEEEEALRKLPDMVWIAPPQAGLCGADPGAVPLPPPDPDRLAYVLYTSGSTGQPKGVKVSMAALMAHACAIQRAFELSPQDRVLQFASLSFDVAIEEILPSLLAGACVVLRPPDMLGAPAQFLERVAALRLSVLNLPTAFWHMLCDDMAASTRRLPDTVRLVIAGGERINPQSLAQWQRLTPGVRWLNGYGLTETTITSTLYEPKGPVSPTQEVPIGRPLAQARAYVLGPDGTLAPTGVAGDLWIGGPAVSDGYINPPQGKDGAFRPDLFVRAEDMPENMPANMIGSMRGSTTESAADLPRIYRSGDRAAWRADGTLAFLGRQDRQVKLRGFRIDLRQVEQVLERAWPGARALAAVRNSAGPAAQLCCWLQHPDWNQPAQLQRDQAHLMRAVMDHVMADLPAHMRPAVALLAQFPRTAGGKIDQAALPDPLLTQPMLNQSTEPSAATVSSDAASPLARQIAGLMAELLGRSDLDVDAGFYEAGGHSLLAMRLIGRIEAETGQRLTPASLHQAPTARHLAALLQAERAADRPVSVAVGAAADVSRPAGTPDQASPSSLQRPYVTRTLSRPRYLLPIQTSGSAPPLFGVHVLGRNEAFYRPLAAALGPDQPVYGLSVGVWDPHSASAAQIPTEVAATAAQYFEDIQTHFPQGPLHLAAVSLGSYFAFDLAQRLLAAGRQLGMVALFDAEGPGGRSRVQGGQRLAAHLRLMRRLKLGYLRHVAHNRLGGLHLGLQQMRRHIGGASVAGAAADQLSIEALIAANQHSVACYHAQPLDARLTIFRAGDDMFDSLDARQQGLGWAPVAKKGFDLIDVSGSHLSMLEPPHVAGLATELQRVMQAATREACQL